LVIRVLAAWDTTKEFQLVCALLTLAGAARATAVILLRAEAWVHGPDPLVV
jgi:hypothetical protein